MYYNSILITLYDSLKQHTLTGIKRQMQSMERKLFSSLEGVLKKNQGCYYTPNYIVRYMVNSAIEQSLIKKINNQIGSNKHISSFEVFLKNQNKEIASLLLTTILPNFAVCDITMGWGVFLLSALEFLFELYSKLFRILGVDFQSVFPGTLNDIEMRNSIVIKIISNNIYGTDLSVESIELAKLKLFEKSFELLETEEALLPDPNFAVGNSLVGYFSRKNVKTSKRGLDREFVEEAIANIPEKSKKNVEEWLINEDCIHWSATFQKIIQEGGFDVIIGNPPYINTRRLKINERKFYSNIYSTYNPNGDISNIFWERSIQLCKNNGVISLIVPRYWLEGYDSRSLRNFLLSNASIKEIIDFRSNRSLFDQTENRLGVDTAIVSVTKKSQSDNDVEVYLLLDNKPVNEINKNRFKSLNIHQSSLSERSWAFEKSPIISYIEEKSEYRLSEDKKYDVYEGICNVGKGCSTGNNRIFRLTKLSKSVYEGAEKKKVVLENFEKKNLRLLIKNSDISRYSWKKRDQYWIFLKNKELEEFPNIKTYLDHFKPILERTQQKYNLNNFYDFAAYRSLSLINHSPKIVCPYQAADNRFALIDSPSIETINETDITTLVIKKKYSNEIDWHYLLTVLNSELIHYYSKLMNKKIYNLLDFRSNQVAGIPITISQQKEPFQTLVKYIMYLRSIENKETIPSFSSVYSIVNEFLNLLVFENYFREKTSSELNEHIRNDLASFPLNKLTSSNITSILQNWDEIIKENHMKRNLKEIYYLSELNEIKQNLYGNSENNILI